MTCGARSRPSQAGARTLPDDAAARSVAVMPLLPLLPSSELQCEAAAGVIPGGECGRVLTAADAAAVAAFTTSSEETGGSAREGGWATSPPALREEAEEGAGPTVAGLLGPSAPEALRCPERPSGFSLGPEPRASGGARALLDALFFMPAAGAPPAEGAATAWR